MSAITQTRQAKTPDRVITEAGLSWHSSWQELIQALQAGGYSAQGARRWASRLYAGPFGWEADDLDPITAQVFDDLPHKDPAEQHLTRAYRGLCISTGYGRTFPIAISGTGITRIGPQGGIVWQTDVFEAARTFATAAEALAACREVAA